MSGVPLRRVAVVVLVLGAALFMLGSVGQEEDGLWPDGPAWIGAIGWFGFLICVLMLLVIGVVAVARSIGSRRTAKG